MMKLMTYPGNFGEPSDSPFCVKIMCLLEMAGARWTPVFSSDPRKAPKQKLPVLHDNNLQIPDSDQIRSYLEETCNAEFDAGLDSAQRAVSRAMIRMMEEHFYFAIVCDRWINDANWVQIKKAYFPNLPPLMNGFITRQVRKQAINQTRGHGMGRHSAQERFERAACDVQAVIDVLGDKSFLFGDQPTAADATVVAMLRAAAATPATTQLSHAINDNASLMAYLDRGKASFYPAPV